MAIDIKPAGKEHFAWNWRTYAPFEPTVVHDHERGGRTYVVTFRERRTEAVFWLTVDEQGSDVLLKIGRWDWPEWVAGVEHVNEKVAAQLAAKGPESAAEPEQDR